MERIIEVPNPQPEIRKTAETNPEWPYREFATNCYRRLDVIKERFFDGIVKPWDQKRLPSPPVAIENMRNWRWLASYSLIPDGYGISDKLTLNEEHMIEENGERKWRFGEWALWETICHEICHQWKNRKSGEPYVIGKSEGHDSKFFIPKLEQLGIHCDKHGVHTQMADLDKPFGILMKEWGISRPEVPPEMEFSPDISWFIDLINKTRKELEGKSTLKKWTCEECGLKIRVGIKGNPEIVHDPCSEKKGEKVFFVRADGLKQTIYNKEH